MSQLRILVFGHGYLGAELALCLHADGVSVVAVHRGSADAGTSYPLVTGDVSDLTSLTELQKMLQRRGFTPARIVHCASSGRGRADGYRSVFVDGIRNLNHIFPGVPIIFTSSTSVYAQKDGSVVTENSETYPERETGQILLEAENLVKTDGGCALRLAGLYGPGRSVHLERMLSGTAAIEDSEPSRLLNQLHRDDAVSAIRHVLKMEWEEFAGQVWNVADDEPITQRECYERLATRFALSPLPMTPPDLGRKRGWTHKAVSNAALRATGWSPRYPTFLGAIDSDPRLLVSIRERIEGRE